VQVLAAQPDQFAAAQSRPSEQQHQQPVTRRPARPQQSDDIFVTGAVGPLPCHRYPMAGLHP
jgi:hypothetical protein